MTHEELIKHHLSHKNYYIKNGVLYITHWLYLVGSQITSIPEKLSIGNTLYLQRTQIISLPDDLVLDGEIRSSNTLLMTEKMQIKLIQQDKFNFYTIKDPTEKAKVLQKLLWVI